MSTTNQQNQYCKQCPEHRSFYQLKSSEGSWCGIPKKLILQLLLKNLA